MLPTGTISTGNSLLGDSIFNVAVTVSGTISTSTILPEASYATNLYISTTAEERNIPITIGNIYSSDVFYKEEDNYKDIVKETGCIACEMESFALFHNAKVLNKRASCLLTISNSFVTNEETTAEERQNAFTKMIELALEASLKM